MATATIETLYRVHDETEGVYLEIKDCPENPNYLSMAASGEKSVEWFGNIEISFTPEYAEKLGHALIAAAEAKKKSTV